jgi:drug/metabolite transporter (DMT)-like permease
LQIGYVGGFIFAFLFLAILIMATRYLRSEEDPYWKSFAFGMVGYSFVMFLMVLTYYAVFIDDLLPIIYFILAGFLVHKKIQKDNAANSQSL